MWTEVAAPCSSKNWERAQRFKRFTRSETRNDDFGEPLPIDWAPSRIESKQWGNSTSKTAFTVWTSHIRWNCILVSDEQSRSHGECYQAFWCIVATKCLQVVSYNTPTIPTLFLLFTIFPVSLFIVFTAKRSKLEPLTSQCENFRVKY